MNQTLHIPLCGFQDLVKCVGENDLLGKYATGFICTDGEHATATNGAALARRKLPQGYALKGLWTPNQWLGLCAAPSLQVTQDGFAVIDGAIVKPQGTGSFPPVENVFKRSERLALRHSTAFDPALLLRVLQAMGASEERLIGWYFTIEIPCGTEAEQACPIIIRECGGPTIAAIMPVVMSEVAAQLESQE